MIQYRTFSYGSVAPLALLFTLVSMSFTVAYLRNSLSQSAMEKYRYTEWKALYAAEAGLNEVGMVVLPTITSDTLILQSGVNYGKDENNIPIGKYKDIACSTYIDPNIHPTKTQYIAWSTGVADYMTASGTNVSIERRVRTRMVPQGFEEFMYFTHEELPVGPGNTNTVNFGSGDQLEGKVHTNGNMTFSNYGCPEFSGSVTITHEAIEQYGNAINWGNCDDNIFEDDDGNIILDTVSQIIFPPDNSAEVAKANANRVFTADDKLFRTGKKDTMIMTEINFTEGGYWATQWWYNIPPVGSPPAEYSFTWVYNPELYGNGLELNEPSSARFALPGTFVPGVGYDAIWLIMKEVDLNGVTVGSDLFQVGDNVTLENSDGTVRASLTILNNAFFPERVLLAFNNLSTSNPPNGPPADFGFTNGETVTITNIDAPTGLDDDIEWNAMEYYHDHNDNVDEYCLAGGRQHFDFEYWNAGGGSCDIFSCPDLIYESEYIVTPRIFYANSSNNAQVIYVRGGQVLIRGVVNGNYTVVTDDYTEYRRHDDNEKIDRVWGNIWLIDDIVYSDSYGNGQVVHPQNGGSNSVLGLIAGGSIIIANTRPNGARGGQYGSNIRINAAMLAMNGGFISHYWQNSLSNFHDWNDGLAYGRIADGRGGHRNFYRSQNATGIYTGNDDIRGTIYLWGAIVQFRRGYIKRNNPGPYAATPGVGYNKDYHYDWNLKETPPPYFPELETTNNSVILRMASYGEARNQSQDME